MSHVHGAGLGRDYGDSGLSDHQNSPLGLAGGVIGEAEPIQLVPSKLQELPEDITMLYQGDSSPDFVSGYTAVGFDSPETAEGQWCYLPIADVMEYSVE